MNCFRPYQHNGIALVLFCKPVLTFMSLTSVKADEGQAHRTPNYNKTQNSRVCFSFSIVFLLSFPVAFYSRSPNTTRFKASSGVL